MAAIAEAKRKLNFIKSSIGERGKFVFEQAYGKATEFVIKPGIEWSLKFLELQVESERTRKQSCKDSESGCPRIVY